MLSTKEPAMDRTAADPDWHRGAPSTWVRVLLWGGVVAALASLVTFAVARAYGGWTGLGLVVVGGAFLLLAGLVLGVGLWLAARQGTRRLPTWEGTVMLVVVWLVAAALLVIPFLATSAAWVHRVAFWAVGAGDIAASLYLLRQQPGTGVHEGGPRP